MQYVEEISNTVPSDIMKVRYPQLRLTVVVFAENIPGIRSSSDDVDCCQYCDQSFNLAFLSGNIPSKQNVLLDYLHHDGPGPIILHQCHTCDFPYLSTFILEGIGCSRAWNMWLILWVFHCNKRHQRCGGPRHRLAAHAVGVEPSNVQMEKSRSYLHV